jgi:hypothetical protein
MSLPLLLIVTMLAAGPAQQTSSSPAADQPAVKQPPARSSAALDPNQLPVSIDRIQRALSQEPAIRLTSGRPVFRVEVFGDKPTIEDILGPDYLKGPVPYGGMTHQEFLDMVTPTDVRGYAAFSNKQGMIVAATSVALRWALQKAMHEYKEAKDQRAREAARKEVQEALEALRKARRAAGLPDK